MKKTILSVAVALIAGLGFSSAASAAPRDNNEVKIEKQDCKEHKSKKSKKSDSKNNKDNRRGGGDIIITEAFEGIELTPEQQTALNNMAQERRDQAKIARQQAKAQQEQNRADMRQQARDKRRQGLEQIKQILTPEQYVEYLENVVISRPGAGRMHRDHANHATRDGGHRGHRNGPAAEPQATPAN